MKGKKIKKVKCSAKTTEGKKCKNYALGKSKYCAVHKTGTKKKVVKKTAKKPMKRTMKRKTAKKPMKKTMKKPAKRKTTKKPKAVKRRILRRKK